MLEVARGIGSIEVVPGELISQRVNRAYILRDEIDPKALDKYTIDKLVTKNSPAGSVINFGEYKEEPGIVSLDYDKAYFSALELAVWKLVFDGHLISDPHQTALRLMKPQLARFHEIREVRDLKPRLTLAFGRDTATRRTLLKTGVEWYGRALREDALPLFSSPESHSPIH